MFGQHGSATGHLVNECLYDVFVLAKCLSFNCFSTKSCETLQAMSQAIWLVDIWPTLCLAITVVPPVIMLTSVFMLCALGKHLLTKCILTKRYEARFCSQGLEPFGRQTFGLHYVCPSLFCHQSFSQIVFLCSMCLANVYRSIAF
jgi:hypothetical protein